MDLWKMVMLAVVQGFTEFLPVSSSGHLVVANALLTEPLPDPVEVSIFLHLGTLFSVLAYYHRRVLRLLGADRRVIPLLIVGTLPAVAVVVAVKKLAPGALERALESPLLAGLMFPVTAVMLIAAMRKTPGHADYSELSWRHALLIGAVQAFAILPGISRSGATIAAGLWVGMRRDSAAAFAFLLAIPAIGGAVVLQSVEMLENSVHTAPWLLATGALIAFAVGLVALFALTNLVARGRLHWFAWWLIPLGVAVTIWQIFW